MNCLRTIHIPNREYLTEAILLVLLFFLSLGVASIHLFYRVDTIGRNYRFEQEWLVPAISLACGQGFTTPSAPYPENMSLFLKQKSNSMSPSDLPKSWHRWDNSNFVKTHRYLITSIGLFWRVFGIRWDLLKIYATIMFVITVITTYIGIRAIFSKTQAFIIGVLTANSPSLLFLLPSLRDYSKAVFFVLFLAVLLWQLKYLSNITIYGFLAGLLGIIVGIGIGFRQDILVLFLLGLAVALLISIFKIYFQKDWKYLIICIVYVSTFILSGFPILQAIRENKGAVSSHSLAQGLAYKVEERLLGGESNYRFAYDSNDMLIHSVVLTNARNKGFTELIDNYLAPQYGSAGRLYFREVAKRFPADLWMRLVSASSNSFSVPYCFDVEQIVIRQEFRRPVRFLKFSNYLILWDKFLAYVGPWALIWTVFLIGRRNVLIGTIFGCILVFMLGYTSILFEFRHIIHLVPILYALVVICVWDIISGILKIFANMISKKGIDFFREVSMRFAKGILTIMVLFMVIPGAYLSLLLWQSWMVGDIVKELNTAEWGQIRFEKIIQGEKILYQPSNPIFEDDLIKTLPNMEVPYKYLRVDVVCDKVDCKFVNKYKEDYPAIDFSESLDELIKKSIEGHGKSGETLVKIYFPVFSTATIKPTGEEIFENTVPIEWVRNQWLGIEIDKCVDCKVLGMYELKESHTIPLIFTVALSDTNKYIKPKKWRWGWNPKDVYFNLEKNTGVFNEMISEFLGKPWSN